MGRNILVVEDDKNISDLIHMYLVKEGFDVRIAGDGGKALEEFQKKEPDLILLDIMLPVMDGWAVCAKIRETSKVPIIMLTAKSEVNDRITGLEMGADDYLVKPINVNELVLRINALLRRAQMVADRRQTLGTTTFEFDSFSVLTGGVQTVLPQKEFLLLYKLVSSPGHIFTRQQLMDDIWGIDTHTDPRTVDVHINRLRDRFRENQDFEIITVRGIGYKAERKHEEG